MCVRKSPPKWFRDVFDHLRQTERTQGSKRESSHHGVIIGTIFGERIGAHLRQLGVGRGIVAQKEIDHFLDDQIAGFNDEHHFGEETGDVNA